MVDVRPADRVRPQDAVWFEATAAACVMVRNWSFRLIHELEPLLAANVRWLFAAVGIDSRTGRPAHGR